MNPNTYLCLGSLTSGGHKYIKVPTKHLGQVRTKARTNGKCQKKIEREREGEPEKGAPIGFANIQ